MLTSLLRFSIALKHFLKFLDSNNIQPSQSSNVKGGFDLKETDDKETGFKFTTRIQKVKSKTVYTSRILAYSYYMIFFTRQQCYTSF